jgi:DNA-binding CsgD family transcriptional regulator
MSDPDAPAIGEPVDSPPLPLTPSHWAAIVAAMGLAPQEARTAELILRGLCYKQIAAVMRLGPPTIRTYFSRIEAKLGIKGQMALAMHVMALSHRLPDPGEPRPQ